MVGIVFVISVGSFYLLHLLPGIPGHGHPGIWQHPGGPRRALPPARPRQAGLPAVLRLDRPRPLRAPGRLLHHPQLHRRDHPRGAADRPGAHRSSARSWPSPSPSRWPCARPASPTASSTGSSGAGSFTLLSVPPFIIIVLLVLLFSIKMGLPNTGPASYVSLPRTGSPTSRAWRCRPSRWPSGASSSTTACCAATSSRPCRKSSSRWRAPRGSASGASCGSTPFAPRRSRCCGAARVNIGGLLAGGLRRPVPAADPRARLHPDRRDQLERLPLGPRHRARRLGRRRAHQLLLRLHQSTSSTRGSAVSES